jgi:hypothetical protein
VRRRIDPRLLKNKTQTGVRLAIGDSLSLSTVVLPNDLGASALESQNRKPDPGLSVSGLFHGGGPGSYGTLNFAIPLKLQRFIGPEKNCAGLFHLWHSCLVS